MVGRENIAEQPWNEWLMRELGSLAADAIGLMKNNEELYWTIYSFIPLTEEIQDESIKQLFNSLFQGLKGKVIGKASEKWPRPEFCAIPTMTGLGKMVERASLKEKKI